MSPLTDPKLTTNTYWNVIGLKYNFNLFNIQFSADAIEWTGENFKASFSRCFQFICQFFEKNLNNIMTVTDYGNDYNFLWF